MPRSGGIPEQLRHGPFTLAEARAAGVSARQLRATRWLRMAHGWYRWAGSAVDDQASLVVVAASLPPGGAFSGLTAARLHGLDARRPDQPEVVIPADSTVARRTGSTLRKVKLLSGDVVRRGGLPVTSPLRTCFDLADRMALVEAVVVLDMALHARLIHLDGFRAYVEARRGVAGVVSARQVLDLAEPKSESPMETRLRLLLVRHGLPRPEAQVELRDECGSFAGRPDLYYRQARLGIEYDGENHRDRLVSDDRRENRLQGMGVLLLRFTGADLRERPDAVVNEVRAALARRPRQGRA